jgi:hypothetical protein
VPAELTLGTVGAVDRDLVIDRHVGAEALVVARLPGAMAQ